MRYYELEIEIGTYPGTAKYIIGVWARSRSGAIKAGRVVAKRRYKKVLGVKFFKENESKTSKKANKG